MNNQYKFTKENPNIGKYSILGIIGQGSEGRVYKAQYKKQLYAIKEMKPFLSINLGIYKNIKKNENLVQFIETFSYKSNSYEVMEYCEGGNLNQVLEKQKFDKNSIIQFLKQFCNGYRELYVNNIIHRDIKPDNIVFQNNKAKIADFGFARFVQNPDLIQELSFKCSPLYASPQLFDEYFSSKCDIWSLGLILYLMVYGNLPNQYANSISALKAFFLEVKHNRIPFPQNDMTSLVNLIKQMLRYSEDDRISWVQLFEHPLINKSSEQTAELYSPRSIQQFNIQVYFENKIYQFQLFNSLINNKQGDLEQIQIILNLWLSYILKLQGQINGTIMIKPFEEKQQMFINGSKAQLLKSIIKEYQNLVESQIKFTNVLNQQKCTSFQMKDQNYLKLNGLQQQDHINLLDCSLGLKEQLKQIFFK